MILDAASASASRGASTKPPTASSQRAGPGISESTGVGGLGIEWRCVSTDISGSQEQVVGRSGGRTTTTIRYLVRYGLNAGDEN